VSKYVLITNHFKFFHSFMGILVKYYVIISLSVRTAVAQWLLC